MSLFILAALCITSCSELNESLTTPLPQEENDDNTNPPATLPTYTNPLMDNGELVWDPAILKDGAIYYAFSVEEGWLDGTRPKVGAFASTDMIKWSFQDAAVDPNTGGWLRGIDAFKTDNKYVMYIFDDNISYFTANSALGTYTKEGSLQFASDIHLGPDAFANFYEEADTKYLVTRFENGIGLLAMNDYKTPQTDAQPIILTTATDLQNPTLVKANNTYYLFAKYKNYWDNGELRVLKASNIIGPYTDKTGGTEGTTVIAAGASLKYINGISGLFEDTNQHHWMYYSASTSTNAGNNQRLCLDRVLWDADGFPYISGYVPSSTEQEAPILRK
jgi:arabinan endo-1,5-alpha-L-arabinosidase